MDASAMPPQLSVLPRPPAASASDTRHPGPKACAALAVAAALTGCGGGVYFELGDGFDDEPPQVNLVADRLQASPGGSVRLAAAATDDFDRIGAVRFYRVDAGGPVLLVVDTAAPFEATLTVPADGRSEVSAFAQAVDGLGQVGESWTVTVQIVP